MSYSSRKYQMLQRLGVEQLRPLREPTSSADGIEEERLCHLFDTNIPIRQTPVRWSAICHVALRYSPTVRYQDVAVPTAPREEPPSGSFQGRDVRTAAPKSTSGPWTQHRCITDKGENEQPVKSLVTSSRSTRAGGLGGETGEVLDSGVLACHFCWQDELMGSGRHGEQLGTKYG